MSRLGCKIPAAKFSLTIKTTPNPIETLLYLTVTLVFLGAISLSASDRSEAEAVVRSMPAGKAKQALIVAVRAIAPDHRVLPESARNAVDQLLASHNEVLAQYAVSTEPGAALDNLEAKQEWTAADIKLLAWSLLRWARPDGDRPEGEESFGPAVRTVRLSKLLVKALADQGLKVSKEEPETVNYGHVGLWLNQIAETQLQGKSLAPDLQEALSVVKERTKDIHPREPQAVQR